MGIFKNLFKKKEEEPKNDYKDLLEKLAEDRSKDLIWLLLASLISSDTLTSIDKCKNSMTILEDLSEAVNRVSESLYTFEERKEIQEQCAKGIEICKQDMAIFESGGYPEPDPIPEPEPVPEPEEKYPTNIKNIKIVPLDDDGNPIENKSDYTDDISSDENDE